MMVMSGTNLKRTAQVKYQRRVQPMGLKAYNPGQTSVKY
jgi:hypothetical protein